MPETIQPYFISIHPLARSRCRNCQAILQEKTMMLKFFIPALMAFTFLAFQKDNTGKLYQLDESVSKAEWKGSAPDHFHTGSFKVTGSMKADDQGKVIEGSFIIPISSIECYDLQDPVKQQLLEHLKTADFFDIALHPDAKFTINKVEELNDDAAGAKANYRLTGDFSMIGQTHSVSFPALITMTEDSIVTAADFTIDRTKWGMKSYSDPKAEMYILPDVQIHLDVRAARDN